MKTNQTLGQDHLILYLASKTAPPIQIPGYTTDADGLKETYKSMETILQLIKYSEYKWSICGDVKVIG